MTIMALIDEVKKEIKMAHTPKVPEQAEKKPEKKRRQRTKEEVAAYIARKQAEEEERMLAKQGSQSPKKQRRKRRKTEGRADAPIPPNQDIPEKKERKPRKNKCESSCTKYRPRHVQTIGLPDGGSLVVIYMAGNQS